MRTMEENVADNLDLALDALKEGDVERAKHHVVEARKSLEEGDQP